MRLYVLLSGLWGSVQRVACWFGEVLCFHWRSKSSVCSLCSARRWQVVGIWRVFLALLFCQSEGERERERERKSCVCLQSHTSTCTHSFIAFYTAFVERTGACSAARRKNGKFVNIYFYECTCESTLRSMVITHRASPVCLQCSFYKVVVSAFCDKVCLSRSVEDIFEDKIWVIF